MSEIPSSTAKDQLIQIDKFLTSPHILIGGLAVQQYHPTRSSKDIDLICDDKTAKSIIDHLYPTKYFEITETNEDDFRPAYVINSKTNEEKVIFIGPKITERKPYQYINWEDLKKSAKPFQYKNKILEKIRVPLIEMLAFTKLLSFLNRTELSKIKGEKDLLDFINLSNNTAFRANFLIDLIRKANCENYITGKMLELSGCYSYELWDQSLLSDFLELMRPALDRGLSNTPGKVSDDKYSKIYPPEESLEFYEKIAFAYDERNTKFIYDGHQSVIGSTISLLPSGGSIVDIGCGTGRLIASHFIHNDKFSWFGVDGSKSMLEQFNQHTRNARMTVKVLRADLNNLDWSNVPFADLCMICFTLSSLASTKCILSAANIVNEGGYLLIADIHPARTARSPYYDFKIGGERIAFKPSPVYPDKLAENLLQQNFSLYIQKTINDSNGKEYAFISIFRKNK